MRRVEQTPGSWERRHPAGPSLHSFRNGLAFVVAVVAIASTTTAFAKKDEPDSSQQPPSAEHSDPHASMEKSPDERPVIGEHPETREPTSP